MAKNLKPISENYFKCDGKVDQSIAECLPKCGYRMGSSYDVKVREDGKNPLQCKTLAHYDNRESYRDHKFHPTWGNAYLFMTETEAQAAENISGMITWRGKQVQKGIWECEWAVFSVERNRGYYNGEVQMAKERGYIAMRNEIGDIIPAHPYCVATMAQGYHATTLAEARQYNTKYEADRKANRKGIADWKKECARVADEKARREAEEKRQKVEARKERERDRRLLAKQLRTLDEQPTWIKAKEYFNSDKFVEDFAKELRPADVDNIKDFFVDYLKARRKFWKDYSLAVESNLREMFGYWNFPSSRTCDIRDAVRTIHQSLPRVIEFREWLKSDDFVEVCVKERGDYVLNFYTTDEYKKFMQKVCNRYSDVFFVLWDEIRNLDHKTELRERMKTCWQTMERKNLSEVIKNEDLTEALDHEYVFQDSLNCGNCRPGTEGFARSHNISLDAHKSGRFLLKIAKGSYQYDNVWKMVRTHILSRNPGADTSVMHRAVMAYI